MIWLLHVVIINFASQDVAPKTIRQVPSWSSLSSSGSSLSRPVSSASSFEKFRQQARDKEERVSSKSIVNLSVEPSSPPPPPPPPTLIKKCQTVRARDKVLCVVSSGNRND